MSGVAPPPGPAPGTGAAAGAPTAAATHAVPATLADVPPAVRQLAAGTVLQGLALGADARGRLLVRTDPGVLALKTRLQVPRGAAVTVQLRSAGAQLHALVMQVQEPAAGAAATRPAPASAGDGTGPPAGDGPRPAPQPGARQAGTARTAPAAAAPADVLAPGRPLAAVVQAPAPDSEAPLPGRELRLRVLEVRAGPGPAASAAATAAEAAARPFTATVVGADAAGRPLLQTPLGALQLAVRSTLPAGTTLLVELAGPAPAPAAEAAAAQAPARTAEPAALLRAWPTLEEAVAVLRAEAAAPDAPAPAETLLRALPQPGPRLASTVLFFLAALGGGDPAGWLGGEAARALERAGRGDLLARLGRDLGRVARLSDEAGGPDWRVLPLPLLAEGEVRPVRLFLRRRGGGAEAASGEEATRFVVELELSRLGELQLDGLVRAARFDLVLRSRRPLAAAMRADIARIFEAANAAAGIAGRLRFQASAAWTAMPLGTPPAAGLVV